MLNINLFEIYTNKEEVVISSRSYNGDWEDFSQLKAENPTYNFYQWYDNIRKENKIYCWSKIRDNQHSLPRGFKSQTISRETHPAVWSKILENSLVNLFQEKGREIFEQRYSHVWELSLLQDESFEGDGISLCPVLKFSLHQ